MNDSRYRLVVQRSPKKEDGEAVTDMFGTVYVYRAIITNDWKMDDPVIDKDIGMYFPRYFESALMSNTSMAIAVDCIELHSTAFTPVNGILQQQSRPRSRG